MKLTKKFIKENAGMTLKEAFPEVFESDLVDVRWYKYNNTLFNYQKNGNVYGFLRGVWKNDNNWFWNSSIGVVTATLQEIQDALEKEAVRRGFEEGNYKCLVLPDHTHKNCTIFKYDDDLNQLFLTNEKTGAANVVFQKGNWAQIIPTITKKEAEERLGMKII